MQLHTISFNKKQSWCLSRNFLWNNIKVGEYPLQKYMYIYKKKKTLLYLVYSYTAEHF